MAFRSFALCVGVAATARTFLAIQIVCIVAEFSGRVGNVSEAGFDENASN